MRPTLITSAVAIAAAATAIACVRPVLANSPTPSIICYTTACGTPIPRPTRTPISTPTPVPEPKNPPGQNEGLGNDYEIGYQWTVTYVDSYAEVQPYGMTTQYPNDSINYSTDEMWRTDGTDTGDWQEIGYVIGLLNGGYFNGLFGAFQEPQTGYVEFAIQGNPPSNDPDANENEVGVSLAVQQGNAKYIDFNYNGHTYNTDMYGQYGNSAYSIVGIESRSSSPHFNAFTSEVDVSDPQILTSGSSTWTKWPSDPSKLSYNVTDPPGDVYCGWAVNVEPSGNEPLTACYHR